MALIATHEGVMAAIAFGFIAGGAAVFAAQAIGRVIDRWSRDDDEPWHDPKNWH
jgi:hypothetical protein